MIIKYQDIVLRAIELSDLELIREMINDPEIENMTGGSGLPVSKYQQEQWFKGLGERRNEVRLVIDTEEHGPIGTVILNNIDYRNSSAEFHSKIATSKDLRGKGYGTKATYALIKYAFEQMNLHCIYSYILDYNIASQKVKEKCGFTKDGILRKRIYKNGEYHDLIAWSIMKEEFERLNSTEK